MRVWSRRAPLDNAPRSKLPLREKRTHADTMARRFASTTSLDTTLYRQLLRLGRALDRSAIARAMLVAAPEQLFDRQTQAVISLPQLDGASAEAVERIAAYNSGEFYAPSSQSAFRHCVVSRSAPVRNDRVDVGLSALRAMGAAAAGAEAISAARPPLPWSEAEAPRLRRGSTPRVGSLLVTHPIACLGQPTLHHAVILLTHVDAERVQGVVRNQQLDTP